MTYIDTSDWQAASPHEFAQWILDNADLISQVVHQVGGKTFAVGQTEQTEQMICCCASGLALLHHPDVVGYDADACVIRRRKGPDVDALIPDQTRRQLEPPWFNRPITRWVTYEDDGYGIRPYSAVDLLMDLNDADTALAQIANKVLATTFAINDPTPEDTEG